MIRLTTEAHRFIREVLRPGDLAIDATAGNGHDTLVLARCIAPDGIVLAIDIQHDAIERTTALMDEHGRTNYRTFVGSHIIIDSLFPCKRSVGAVMFNLGYRPQGDHTITTQTASTIEALRMACEVIRVGGIVTVIAYRGHAGGAEETHAVRELVRALPTAEFETHEVDPVPTSPVLIVIRRRG
jgi:predicted methyltransferase